MKVNPQTSNNPTTLATQFWFPQQVAGTANGEVENIEDGPLFSSAEHQLLASKCSSQNDTSPLPNAVMRLSSEEFPSELHPLPQDSYAFCSLDSGNGHNHTLTGVTPSVAEADGMGERRSSCIARSLEVTAETDGTTAGGRGGLLDDVFPTAGMAPTTSNVEYAASGDILFSGVPSSPPPSSPPPLPASPVPPLPPSSVEPHTLGSRFPTNGEGASGSVVVHVADGGSPAAPSSSPSGLVVRPSPREDAAHGAFLSVNDNRFVVLADSQRSAGGGVSSPRAQGLGTDPEHPGPLNGFWDTPAHACGPAAAADRTFLGLQQEGINTGHAPQQELDSRTLLNSTAATGSTGTVSVSLDGNQSETMMKRRRGRPKGSKNRKLSLSAALASSSYAMFPSRQRRALVGQETVQVEGRLRYIKKPKYEFDNFISDLVDPHSTLTEYPTPTSPVTSMSHLAGLPSTYGYLPPESVAVWQHGDSTPRMGPGLELPYLQDQRVRGPDGGTLIMVPGVPGGQSDRRTAGHHNEAPGSAVLHHRLSNTPVLYNDSQSAVVPAKQSGTVNSLSPESLMNDIAAASQVSSPFLFASSGAEYSRSPSSALSPFLTRISQFERCALCGETGQNHATAFVCTRRTCQRLFCLKCIALSSSKPGVAVFNEQLHECIVCIYQSRKRALGDPNQWHFEFKDINDGHFVRMLRDVLPFANGLFIEISKTRQPCWRRKLRNKARKHFSFRFYGGIFESRLEALEIGRGNTARLTSFCGAGAGGSGQDLSQHQLQTHQDSAQSHHHPGQVLPYSLPSPQLSSPSPVATLTDDNSGAQKTLLLEDYNVAEGIPFTSDSDYAVLTMGRVGMGSALKEPDDTEEENQSSQTGKPNRDESCWSAEGHTMMIVSPPIKSSSLKDVPPAAQSSSSSSSSSTFRTARYDEQQNNHKTLSLAVINEYEGSVRLKRSTSGLEKKDVGSQLAGFSAGRKTSPPLRFSPDSTTAVQPHWPVDINRQNDEEDSRGAPGCLPGHSPASYANLLHPPTDSVPRKVSREDASLSEQMHQGTTSASGGGWLALHSMPSMPSRDEANDGAIAGETVSVAARRPSFSVELVGDPVLSSSTSPALLPSSLIGSPQLTASVPQPAVSPAVMDHIENCLSPVPANSADPRYYTAAAPPVAGHPSATAAVVAGVRQREHLQALAAAAAAAGYDPQQYEAYYSSGGALTRSSSSADDAAAAAAAHYSAASGSLYHHHSAQADHALDLAYFGAVDGQQTPLPAPLAASIRPREHSPLNSPLQTAHQMRPSNTQTCGTPPAYHSHHRAALDQVHSSHRVLQTPPQNAVGSTAALGPHLHLPTAYPFPPSSELPDDDPASTRGLLFYSSEQHRHQCSHHSVSLPDVEDTSHHVQTPPSSAMYGPLLSFVGESQNSFGGGVSSSEQGTMMVMLGDATNMIMMGQRPNGTPTPAGRGVERSPSRRISCHSPPSSPPAPSSPPPFPPTNGDHHGYQGSPGLFPPSRSDSDHSPHNVLTSLSQHQVPSSAIEQYGSPQREVMDCVSLGHQPITSSKRENLSDMSSDHHSGVLFGGPGSYAEQKPQSQFHTIPQQMQHAGLSSCFDPSLYNSHNELPPSVR